VPLGDYIVDRFDGFVVVGGDSSMEQRPIHIEVGTAAVLIMYVGHQRWLYDVVTGWELLACHKQFVAPH
jgi:hypothetical protein